MIGRQLAHYTITAHLGSGGMGDVYQATDTKLARSVALKFLPEAFAADIESATRFRREAKTLASLNHPHIAAIHGLEDAEGRSFLVMELVPGQTLAERIARRPPSVDEAISIARQIAEALEAAHEKGIVHRDLKPANVKITPEGNVKVLDFGLAKPVSEVAEERGQASLGNAATKLVTATHQGTILGTPAYMAPEQARGLQVDRRADIFAFGCILYEMLCGRRAFDGESATEVISRILQREPDWARIPSSVPPSIHRLLRLCLEKDPKRRRQAAGDVRIDLEHALLEPAATTTVEAPRPSRLSRLLWIAGGAVLIAALAIPAVRHAREESQPEMRLQIVTPPALDPVDFALSPDGLYIVFAASPSSDAPQRLYVRTLSKEGAKPLTGTEGGRLPFWSADSKSVGFFASGKLYRVDITGGPPQELAAAGVPLGGTWNTDGTILFTPNSVSPVFQVPASGGTAVPATQLESPRQNNHRAPFFLPDGRQFLFYAPGDSEVSGIFLGTLDGKPPKRLTAAKSAGAFLPPDRIVYLLDGALVSRKLDTAHGQLTGDPVTLADSANGNDAITGFSVSANGIVAYRAGRPAPTHLTWFDHEGKANVLEGSEGFNAPDLSTDERFLAFDRTNPKDNNRDVWLLDLNRSVETHFTFDPKVDGFPIWSQPDRTRVAFESNRKGSFDVWIKAANGAPGTEQFLYGTPDYNEWPLDWSTDGQYVLYCRTNAYYISSDLFALPMTGENREPIAIASTPSEERMGDFSPDGHWVVYETDESGHSEIVAQAFPKPNGIVHVSTGGGSSPRWSADGSEITFIAPDGKMMAVHVTRAGSTLNPDKAVALFPTQIQNLLLYKHQYVVAKGGRFAVINRQAEPVSPITLILNLKP